MSVTAVGLELAKYIFQVHGANDKGQVLFASDRGASRWRRFWRICRVVWSGWKPVRAPTIGRVGGQP